MDKYDIQVNKTSRNSVLFQTNIGTHCTALHVIPVGAALLALRPRLTPMPNDHVTGDQ
jgi:hypothetical protein